MMIEKLRQDLARRQDDIYQFYFLAFGSLLKKRRKELHYTQELVAKGICSNTYISKLENNQITVNKDSLMMIMERMDMPSELADFPDQMFEYLQRAIRAFIWNDEVAYEVLFSEMAEHDFGVLIELARYGFHIMKGDIITARKTEANLYRYFTAMDNYAVVILVMFGVELNIRANNYETAKAMADLIDNMIVNDREIFGYLHFLKFIANGYLHLFTTSAESENIAKDIFHERGNVARMAEMLVYRHEFRFYEGKGEPLPYHASHVALLKKRDADKYHLIHALTSPHPLPFFEKIDETSELYYFRLYEECRHHLRKNNTELFQIAKGKLLQYTEEKAPAIDLYHFLSLQESANVSELKDFLADRMLAFAIEKQNIHFMKDVTEVIVKVLSANKRYKDALGYQLKCEKEIARLRNTNKNRLFD